MLVILLQEVPVLRGSDQQVGPWLADCLGYSLCYARANGSAAWIGFEEGEAVLTRFPIRECRRYPLRPRPGAFENRVVLYTVVDTPLGALEVYNTHLPHRLRRDRLRLLQVQDLLGFMRQTYRLRELPAVLGGDFNSLPGSGAIQALLAEGFRDAALEVDPRESGPTAGIADLTDPAASPRARIDYLFFLHGVPGARDLSVRFSAVGFSAVRSFTRFLDRALPSAAGPLWASDHVGLFCELAVR